MSAATSRHTHRLATLHHCEQCGEPFYPWRASARRFCSGKCSGQAKSDAARKLRRTRSDPIDPKFAAAFREEATAALETVEKQLRATEEEAS